MRIFVTCFLVSIGSSAFAKEATIPFIVKQRSVSPVVQSREECVYAMKDPKTGKTMAVTESEKVVDVPAGEISKVIKSVRDEVCAAVEDGEFKIWLKGEASGKILGVGASSEAGIEVTVKCEKPKKSKASGST